MIPALALVFGYALAAYLTPVVSFTFSATAWGTALPYVYIAAFSIAAWIPLMALQLATVKILFNRMRKML